MTHPIPDEALDSDIAIIARKGSGKSYLARGLAERLLDLKRRMVVIDPLGAWWGLRASADGQSAGYPVAVFGGEHADMPLSATMGEPLAKLIAGDNLPCVIDTSLMRKEEQGQLAIDLFEGLFRFNKDALTIILEEADVFAPQNPAKDGYAARVLHEVDRIARRGRARGLRLISLTQRPARLHKDVLSQAAALVAMRLTSPHDQGAIEDWIKGNANSDQAKEVMDSLATLPVGSGWIWAPDLDMLKKVAFPRIKTLDTSATPKAGETRVEPKTLAQVDVSAIREALQVEPQVDPTKKGAKYSDPIPDPAAEERGYQRGLVDWRIGFEREALASFAEIGRQIDEAFAPLRALAEANTIAAAPVRREPTPARASPEGDGTVTGPQIKVLGALAWWAAMGKETPLRPQVAAICGWAASSGHLKNVLGSLSSAGLVTYPAAGQVQMTPAGAAVAPEPDMSMTVIDGVRAVLTGPQKLLFEALLPGGQIPMDRPALAEAVGWAPTSGHLKNTLGSLSTLQVVTYPSKGSVALSGWIFA